MERICASTDKGELVFFKITTHQPPPSPYPHSGRPTVSSSLRTDGLSGASGGASGTKGKSSPAPPKLLIHQPLTLTIVHQLFQLTLAERFPQSVNMSITAPSCWTELALTQRQVGWVVACDPCLFGSHCMSFCSPPQRRQPASWLVQPGPIGHGSGGSSGPGQTNNNTASSLSGGGLGEDGLYGQMARVFRLQQDKFSWDEHFFEISLPAGAGSLAHIHLRFVLAPNCTVPPEIQVIGAPLVWHPVVAAEAST